MGYNTIMNTSSEACQVESSIVTPEENRIVRRLLEQGVRPRLIVPDGEVVELSDQINDLLLRLLRMMESGRTVQLISEDESFTTQAAANFLGMSRPYLLRLLEAGKLPFYKIGTHRRILLRDLMAFADERSRERASTLSRMTRELVDADLYDRFVDPAGDTDTQA
jgi:excisionase family DNA binding protein